MFERTSAPSWIMVLVLLVGVFGQSNHNGSIRDQLERMHKAQMVQISDFRKFEYQTTEKMNVLTERVAQLEVTNEMLQLPIYKDHDTGRVYLDGWRN